MGLTKAQAEAVIDRTQVRLIAKRIVDAELHRGMDCEALINKLAAAPRGTDPWTLDLTKDEQAQLAQALLEGDDPKPCDMFETEVMLLRDSYQRMQQVATHKARSATSLEQQFELQKIRQKADAAVLQLSSMLRRRREP